MTVATCDVRDAFAQKVKRGIFDPVARHLREDLRDDRLAEGVALTFEKYAKEAEQGTVLDDALLVHVCRLRATDLSRRVAGAGGCQPKRDVLDERNRAQVGLVHLDDPEQEDGLAVAMSSNPTRRVHGALDLHAWFATLEQDERELLALRQAGHTLTEIGEAIGASTSAVFQRLRRLGHELAERAQVVAYAG
jgi:hypothetical protein